MVFRPLGWSGMNHSTVMTRGSWVPHLPSLFRHQQPQSILQVSLIQASTLRKTILSGTPRRAGTTQRYDIAVRRRTLKRDGCNRWVHWHSPDIWKPSSRTPRVPQTLRIEILGTLAASPFPSIRVFPVMTTTSGLPRPTMSQASMVYQVHTSQPAITNNISASHFPGTGSENQHASNLKSIVL